MRVVADLHVHSKYARATSQRCDVEGLSEGCRIKGVNIVATGDFTHPQYFNELRIKLKNEENGLFPYGGVYFILSTEVALFYQVGKHQLRIHNVVLAPGMEEAMQLNDSLKNYGSLEADGRPMLKMSSAELVDECEKISSDFFIFPAHVWTPWFGIFGSVTGVDSIEEAFEDRADRVYALETGLSSDPQMNWMVSKLDRYTLISNSDAHSPEKLGREANVFDLESITYGELINSIKTRKGFIKTYEFYPEEGKYHYDGHRNCGIRWSPWESKKHKNICPVCKKPVTIGVLHRVVDLADRKMGERSTNAVPFQYVIPLKLLISKVLKKPETAIAVKNEYERLIKYFSNEFAVYEATEDAIKMATSSDIAKAIIKAKHQEVKWLPGYDGVFGELIIDESNDKKPVEKKQKNLLEF
ncbi:MAG: endonuclease Q family protein [Candidatus Bilamarchaeaceae archaeon]